MAGLTPAPPARATGSKNLPAGFSAAVRSAEVSAHLEAVGGMLYIQCDILLCRPAAENLENAPGSYPQSRGHVGKEEEDLAVAVTPNTPLARSLTHSLTHSRNPPPG